MTKGKAYRQSKRVCVWGRPSDGDRHSCPDKSLKPVAVILGPYRASLSGGFLR